MLCGVFILGLFAGVLGDNWDGGKAHRVPLSDGTSIPAMGLGTFLGFDENGQKEVLDREVEDPVSWALNAGYRLIDTASVYKNEHQVGRAIHKSGIPRENIFVVTKLATNEKRDVVGALRNSLSRLNLTYVDLYLIHFPISFSPDFKSYDLIDYVKTWQYMEEAKRLGLARSIGISNFNISQIERLLDNCKIRPTVLEVEVNLNLAQHKLLDYCKSQNITVIAYTPFGSLFEKDEKRPPPRFNDPALQELAKKYGKTVPQLVLRYLVQRGVIPIPKSVRKERLEENINIFDFEISQEDMTVLGKYNKDFRVVLPSFWQDHPYYPFEKKEVPDENIFAPKKKDKMELNVENVTSH